MKIIKIRINNINSLKGIHEIDFSAHPLSESGLFAITGPTGSGKTTILDAITLGLYNQVPRVGRVSKNFISEAGVILTRNSLEAFSEVTFECSEGTFISKWSITTARTGTLKDYHMEIAPAKTMIPLDIKKGSVPEKNSELIGMNYEQFVRAIILAQGDFAAFLKAKEDERGKLLEQITGGEIYRKLGRKAYEMFKQYGEELERKMELRDSLRDLLIEKEEFEQLMATLKQVDEELSYLDKTNKSSQEAINLKNEINETEESLQALNDRYSKYKIDLETFQEKEGVRLDRHLKLVPVQEKLQQWKRTLDSESSVNEEIERLSGLAKQNTIEISELKDRITRMTKDIESEPLDALEQFQKKMLDLDRQIMNEQTRLEQKREILEGLALKTEISFTPEELDGFEAVVREKIGKTNSDIKSLENRLDTSSTDDPNEALKALRSLQEKVNEINIVDNNLIELYKNQKVILKEYNTLSVQITEFPARISAQEKVVSSGKLKRDNLQLEAENRTLRASLEEHRKNLVPGEPCPLCGAVEHPLFKEDNEKSKDQLAEQLQHSEKVLQEEMAELVGLKTNFQNKKDRFALLEQQKSEIDKKIKVQEEQMSLLLNALPEKFKQDEMSMIQKRIKDELVDLEQYSELIRVNEDLIDIPKTLNDLKTLSRQHAAVSKSRYELFEGEDVTRATNELSKKWNEKNNVFQNYSERLKEYRERKETIQKQVNEYDETILEFIRPLGYQHSMNALKDLLTPESAENLRNKKQKISDSINSIETERKMVTERISEMKSKDCDESLDKLREILDSNISIYNKKKEERDDVISKKKTQEMHIARIDELNQEIGKLEKENLKWKLLKELIGDKEGKKFSTFAQKLTLYKLILLANNRLKSLNDRYLLDLPKEDEDESLSVIDTYMGDQRRSVKSLSGGETFLISLGLALALSDLASRDIKINSLFIDEGFGSLDKLTLDQTIDTLEKLQYESGKNIGVISHVEAMQERITTQIRVNKNGQGYSSIEIK